MDILVFSDESGSWHEGEYYIRSWVKIPKNDYDLLRKEVIWSKHETGIKELKWEKFRKNIELCKNIFDIKFDIFVTISKPKHLETKKYYGIMDTLNSIKTSTGGEKITEKIKSKIIKSAKNELFFNFFEKTHIKNSVEAFSCSENVNSVQYIIDSPQYLDKSWIEVAKECGIENIKIEKFSDIPGIELADIVSGCINYMLKNDLEATKIFSNYIRGKMLYKDGYPNPNLIFYQDFLKEESENITQKFWKK